MYQLTCELYEYEDAVIDTSIEEIDNNAEDDGYIATLTLAGVGDTAHSLTMDLDIQVLPLSLLVHPLVDQLMQMQLRLRLQLPLVLGLRHSL